MWIAAEHESDERLAEEISQLLYRVQVLMLGRGLTPRRRLPPPMTRTKGEKQMLRVAVPNKGALAGPAEMLAEAGYRNAMSSATSPWSTRSTRSSSSSCGPRTSPSTSAPASWTSASPAATWPWTPAPRSRSTLALGFGGSKFRYAAPAGREWKVGRPAGQAAGDVLPAAGRGRPRRARHGGRGDPARRRGRDLHPARRRRRDRRRRRLRPHAAPAQPRRVRRRRSASPTPS